MTQHAISAGSTHSDFSEITRSCEKLLNETQADLDYFRHEQNQQRHQILDILHENKRLNSQLEVLKCNTLPLNDSRDDATREQLCNAAAYTIRQQIQHLKEENLELRNTFQNAQTVIKSLEEEIQEYRTQTFQPNKLGEKYTTAIKLLESSIKTQQAEIIHHEDVIKNLNEQNQNLRQDNAKLTAFTKELQAKLVAQDQVDSYIKGYKEQLQEAKKQIIKLQRKLEIAEKEIKEGNAREQTAVSRVHESLALVDRYTKEKDEAERREKIVKEECYNIASTIGEVMDEAAKEVDKNMEATRRKYDEKYNILIAYHEKLKEELLSLRKYNKILEQRCEHYASKYSEACKESSRLVQDLQFAQKVMEDLDNKVEFEERSLNEETEREIQHYINANKQLKEKYKAGFEDMTRKFENEIYVLQNENANLKAENKILKASKLQVAEVAAVAEVAEVDEDQCSEDLLAIAAEFQKAEFKTLNI